MNERYFDDESRTKWYSTTHDKPNTEQLQLGCLQRIASATELMAKNYDQLIQERDRYKRYYNEQHECSERLVRSNAALRGQITKLKKKLRK